MKNITVSLDDETYRRARIKAAEQDSSVSALVKAFLISLSATESEAERMKREEIEIRAKISDFRANDRLSREEIHRRDY
jgi:plasmid stability protein